MTGRLVCGLHLSALFWIGGLGAWGNVQLLAADPLAVWTAPSGGVPTTANLEDVAFGGGVFVAVGEQGTVIRSSDAEQWTLSDAGTKELLLAVQWSNDRFVATDGLRTATSPDGVNWSAWVGGPAPGASPQVNRSVYGAGYYVELSSRNFSEIHFSADGVNWEYRKLEGQPYLNALTYGANRFVAVGAAGAVRLSGPAPAILNNSRPKLSAVTAVETDELGAWQHKLTAVDPDPFGNLTFGLVPGAPPGMSANPATGELAWTPQEEDGPVVHRIGVWVRDGGNPPLIDVLYFDLAVREINRAPQLRPLPGVVLDHDLTVSIEATDLDSPLNELHYDLDSFPEGTLLNLTTRQYFWTPTADQLGRVVEFGIRVTDDGSPPLTASHRLQVLARTRDTLTLEPAPLLRWKAIEVPILSSLIRRLKFVGGRFVAVGDEGSLFSSPDGERWVRLQSGTKTPLNGVAEGAGALVVVGDKGTVLVSQDGIAWQQPDSKTISSLRLVAYGSGKFVALGGNPPALLTSPDGYQWTNHGAPGIQGTLRDLVWTGQGFLAVGGDVIQPGDFIQPGDSFRTVGRSLDGLSWVEDADRGIPLERAAQGGQRTVAVGFCSYNWRVWGSVEVTRDGVNWSRSQESLLNSMAWHDVAYGDGRFVAVGDISGKGPLTRYYHLISRDGVHWQPHLYPEGISLWGGNLIAYGNGRFVVIVGNTGDPYATRRVLLSASTLPPEPRAVVRAIGEVQGGLALALHGQNDVPYWLETSEDLVNWRQWRRFTGQFSGSWEVDPGSTGVPQRFYRIVPLP